jgi:hypothetical protein
VPATLVVANSGGFAAGAVAGLSWVLALVENTKAMIASMMRNMIDLRNIAVGPSPTATAIIMPIDDVESAGDILSVGGNIFRDVCV